jgi:hypothetical protein
MKATVLRTKYEGSFSAGAADFGQCVEHRLKMKGRTADDLPERLHKKQASNFFPRGSKPAACDLPI